MNQPTYKVAPTFSRQIYGAQWRPPQGTLARQMGVSRRPQVMTRRLGQAGRIATGADMVSRIVVGGAAIIGGIALATIVGSGDPKRPTWKWIGGITAVLGALKIFSDVSDSSVSSGAPSARTGQ